MKFDWGDYAVNVLSNETHVWALLLLWLDNIEPDP